MLGHWAGSSVQFAIEYICTTKHLGVACTASAVFIHEFIVEPVVNTAAVSYFKTTEENSSHEFNLFEVIFGAIGAIIFAKGLEFLAYGHIVTSAASLVGSIAGEWIYDKFFE